MTLLNSGLMSKLSKKAKETNYSVVLLLLVLILMAWLARPQATRLSSAVPAFSGNIRPLNNDEINTMLASGSWHQGCPLSFDQLQIVEVSYWGFDSAAHTGKIMVNTKVAKSVESVFKQLYNSRYPIHQMNLVDNFGGSDEKSMLADNTSGYNCRRSPLDNSWSLHSYGLAVDINPFENPEILDNGQRVDPPAAQKFANRSLNAKGVIKPNDAAIKAFAQIGWQWGGNWEDGWQDWQHFYTHN